MVKKEKPFKSLLQEFVYYRTYSRWLDSEQRRENWDETVARYCDYMKTKYGDKISDKEYKDVYSAIYNLEVMPSMRALWSAGRAADSENIAFYNCSFTTIEKLKDFAEILYILMNGTGVGYSVERKYINKLPVIQDKQEIDEVIKIVFEDSKMGWARGFLQVLESLWNGIEFECDYSKIRPMGARLKTFGGRASGKGPLIDLINFTTDIVERNRGFQIRPIDAHDICCKIAEIVVVGGVRRCLPYYAPIFTEQGVKQIKDIVPGDFVETGGETFLIKDKVSSGKQSVLKIKHDFGFIECTANHRVAVFNEFDTGYSFKFAKDIKEGDCLVWDLEGYTGSKTNMAPIDQTIHFNSKKVKVPELTPDISWLIGFIHGDGHIADRSIEITTTTTERQLLDKANLVFREFGVSGKISKGNGDCLRLRVNSKVLCNWFKKYIKQSSVDIKIPNFIMNGEKPIRRAYLAGLFDADGRGRIDGVCEQATTIYETFANQLVTLLAGLGIGSSVYFGSTEKRRESGVNCKDFYSLIIKGITNRRLWLNSVAHFSVSSKFSKVGNSIGNSNDFKYKASMFGNPAGWKKDGYITFSSAVDHGFIDYSSYVPTVVVSVEQGSEVETFDIGVDTVERFTTNGIVVHNSACISLSDLTDNEMSNAKSGEFWHSHPQRSLANNSVAYTRKPDIISFLDEWKNLYRSKCGERGIFSRVAAQKKANENDRRDGNKVVGTNPCGEVLLPSKSFCNLTEVVCYPEDTFETLKRKIKIATLIGTWQAGFTKFKFIDKEWKNNCEEEALLGVSITGLRDHSILGSVNDTAKKWLSDLKHIVIATNKKAAQKIGINRAAAATCNKPSGTVSLLVNCAPGAHVRATETGYYIRRIRISATDPLYVLMRDAGALMQPEVGQTAENCTTWVLEFPCEAPKSARLKGQDSSRDQLEYWKMLRSFYCEHNPSITIYVDEDEWLDTATWVYKNFEDVGGLTFLPKSDHVYQLAPYEDIDYKRYQELIKTMPEIDFSLLTHYEKEDQTTASKEFACTGGACELR